jgi:hypothetical protein
VGVLIAFLVVDRTEAECRSQGRDILGSSSQKVRGGGQVTPGANLCILHGARIGCRVLWIEADHDEAEISSWPQSCLPQGVGDDADDRSAQGFAGVVGKNPQGRLAAQPLLDRVDLAGLVLQLQIRRQRRARFGRGFDVAELLTV